ncbi:MAG: alpha/beta hydrolase [Chloroflexota bacterium]|nr:alpha/beta hydrolase [Chloroflexota bacterium]
MSAVVIEGGLIHYEYLGRGKPLLFLHGWLGSWRYWMATMEELSIHYRAYALDLWGFGDSDKSRNKYTVREYVELVYAFLDKLGMLNKRVSLVGHALGAAVAVDFARQYPQHADRVLAVSLPITGATVNRRLLTQGSGSLFDRVLGRDPLAGYRDVEVEVDKTEPVAIDLSVQSVMAHDLRSVIGDLGVPLLVVHGGRDTVVTLPEDDCFQDEGGLLRAISFPDSRHFPMLDEAAKFTRLLMDFLELEEGQSLEMLEVKEEWRRRTR